MVGWCGAESRDSANERAAYIGDGSKLAIGMLLWEKDLEIHTQGTTGEAKQRGPVSGRRSGSHSLVHEQSWCMGRSTVCTPE